MNEKQANTGTQSAQDGNRNSECQAPNGHTLEAAHDECKRENEVRKRCYGKWIDEGRLSRTDARDRTERLDAAMHFLQKLEQCDSVLFDSVMATELKKPLDKGDTPF